MEHVDGKDLRSILERCRQQKRPIPPQHAAHIAAEVATALHAAHTALDQQGKPLRIVHRDVSPSNVICSYTGEVKLCDFGIAKATLSKVNTKTGVIKGKVKYMSPEQALGRRLDHRSDVFSLGSCLYEMLTRVPPFTATNEMDLLIKVRDAKYRPISDMVPSIPREIETICDRCLTRSRAHRYQTADDVARALRGFLHHYMPSYSRSHMGRYVRKKFSAEIERELRMLEEFVVEPVHGDLGENLIANVLGPKAEYTEFTPRPTRVPGVEAEPEPASAGLFGQQHVSGATTLPRPPSLGGEEDEGEEGDDDEPPIDDAEPVADLPPLPRAQSAGDASADPEERTTGERGPHRLVRDPADEPFDIHSAETMILDRGRQPPRSDFGSDDFDEALHNAPTLILDSRRNRRRK
jgi:serine/threonine-protein kinase